MATTVLETLERRSMRSHINEALTTYLSNFYQNQLKVDHRETKCANNLQELFNHSQKVYFQNHYYIKYTNMPEFEKWLDYLKEWQATRGGIICSDVFAIKPHRHSWGYVVEIPIDVPVITNDFVEQTQNAAQALISTAKYRDIRNLKVVDLLLYQHKLLVLIQK